MLPEVGLYVGEKQLWGRINGKVVTLYLQEQKPLIALIALQPLFLVPSPPTACPQCCIVGWVGPLEVQHGEEVWKQSPPSQQCFRDVVLYRIVFSFRNLLPLPKGSFVNLMLLALLLDISFLQPLQRHLELCQCHSLLQSGGDLPPVTPAVQSQPWCSSDLSLSSFSSLSRQSAAEAFWSVIFVDLVFCQID